MVRLDLAWLAVAHLLFLVMVIPYKKLMTNKVIRYIMMLVPLIFLGNIVLTWGGLMLRTASHVDAHLAYDGIAAEGTPYIGPKQNQTPTFYAFTRFLSSFGDGSFEAYDRWLLLTNYLCLGLLAGGIVLAVVGYFKEQENISGPTLIALASAFMAGMLPAAMNLHLANINIVVGALVAFYLYITRTFRNDRADFIGGMALGTAFMIKPCILFVLIYLFFLGLRRKRVYVLAGIVTAGAAGFMASLLAPGIGISAYGDYLGKVSETTYSILRKSYYGINLSLMKYLPTGIAKAVIIACVIGSAVTAFFLTKKNRGGELPWFFLTLLPFPILWEEHLMAIFPAFIFLILSKEKDGEQIMVSAVASSLILFASLLKVPLVVNALLLGLWFWAACLPSSGTGPHRTHAPAKV